MGKTKNKKLPIQSVSAGDGFVVTGIIFAILGLFVIVIEMFNRAEYGPMLLGSSGVIFGLLLMVVGYAKKTAIASLESYLLQKRIYEEQQEVTSSSAE